MEIKKNLVFLVYFLIFLDRGTIGPPSSGAWIPRFYLRARLPWKIRPTVTTYAALTSEDNKTLRSGGPKMHKNTKKKWRKKYNKNKKMQKRRPAPSTEPQWK